MERNLQYLMNQGPSFKAMREGKLHTLDPKVRKGLIVASGRVPEDDLATVLGKPVLPVLMSSTTLASLILRHCHQEDHRRSPSDCVARSRRFVWIPRAMKLAKFEVNHCLYCRLARKKLQKQVISSIPQDRVTAISPFSIRSLDLFCPIKCCGIGGQ